MHTNYFNKVKQVFWDSPGLQEFVDVKTSPLYQTSPVCQTGVMGYEDTYALYSLAKSVPDNGHIIEIGTAWGGSASVMATINPRVKITTFDPYLSGDEPWISEWSARYGREYGYEPTAQYLAQWPNVEVIRGRVPVICQDWSSPVDMIFEDAAHTYNSVRKNLEFWNPLLKEGGIFSGHDYSNEYHPGVVDAVNEFRNTYYSASPLQVCGTIWFFYKI